VFYTKYFTKKLAAIYCKKKFITKFISISYKKKHKTKLAHMSYFSSDISHVMSYYFQN